MWSVVSRIGFKLKNIERGYEKNCSKLLDGGVLLGSNLLRFASHFNNSVSGIVIVVCCVCWISA